MKFAGAALRRAMLLSCAVGLLGGAPNIAVADELKSYDIDAQGLSDALREFSLTSKRNLLFSPELVRGKNTQGASGTFSAEEVLRRILTGTGLEFDQTPSGALVLRKAGLKIDTAAETGAAIQAVQVAAQPSMLSAELSEEIIVTGSRIVREGYRAPTPLTVVGTEALDSAADPSMVNFLGTMPAVTGSLTPVSGTLGLAGGIAGIQSLNLRSLGGNRVLVLLDGQRTVPSSYTGLVDTATFPSQLISRVDIVTGGASAVYGSDAVAGVVNFVIDREFTGVKGEASGGLTNYGDGRNYKVGLSGGFAFSGGRGHVLLSGEHMNTGGVQGDGGRAQNRTGHIQFTNPAYTPTNGQPQLLFLPGSALATATPGGIVVAGPLKGTAFGAGGTPYRFQYGPIVSGALMQGGDWKSTDMRPYADMDGAQSNQRFFTRVSYDVTDKLNVFAQWAWAQNRYDNEINYAWMPGTATSFLIQVDNAYLPPSVRAAMIASGVTSVPIGTWNFDLPKIGNDNVRLTNRLSGGVEGTLDAFGSPWSWNAYYGYGATKLTLRNPFSPLTARYRVAIDTVVNPANGQVVCRAALNGTSPGCRPWNPLGIGVNADNQGALSWLDDGGSFQIGLVEQRTLAAAVSGAPFSNWAGPVSLALSGEHRTDKIHTRVDNASRGFQRLVGNYAPLDGEQSVTEGALETVLPLAVNEAWARSWDVSAAMRFTAYEYAGYVTTWKAGTTFAPVPDIRFRFTRSRDIRAPSIQESFAAPAATIVGNSVLDRFRGDEQTPTTTRNSTGGNINLEPEKADTTGIGLVLAPRFLKGFAMSVDYWDLNLKSAIQALSAQQVVDLCFNGRDPAQCPNIVRDAAGQIEEIRSNPINLARQNVRGIDLEGSYRMPLSTLFSGVDGSVSFHGLMTFYLRNYIDNTFNTPVDRAGENNADYPPHWKLNLTSGYQRGPISASLTARAISKGVINRQYIVCASGCPVSTFDHQTINNNTMAGRFYLDASVTYKVLMDGRESDVFFSVKNVFNNAPPPNVTAYFTPIGYTATLYDHLGTVYRTGIRFKM